MIQGFALKLSCLYHVYLSSEISVFVKRLTCYNLSSQSRYFLVSGFRSCWRRTDSFPLGQKSSQSLCQAVSGLVCRRVPQRLDFRGKVQLTIIVFVIAFWQFSIEFRWISSVDALLPYCDRPTIELNKFKLPTVKTAKFRVTEFTFPIFEDNAGERNYSFVQKAVWDALDMADQLKMAGWIRLLFAGTWISSL